MNTAARNTAAFDKTATKTIILLEPSPLLEPAIAIYLHPQRELCFLGHVVFCVPPDMIGSWLATCVKGPPTSKEGLQVFGLKETVREPLAFSCNHKLKLPRSSAQYYI